LVPAHDIATGRKILNLDSEEDGIITIGCAGGVDLTASFPRPATETVDSAVSISISGCRGGHSGVNIHEGRANAIATIANLALRLRSEQPGLRLLDFTGGSKRNAIPREAQIIVADCDLELAQKHAARVEEELRLTEPDAVVAVATTGPVEGAAPFEAVEFVRGCPMGILRFEPTMPDLVRTSNSIGVVASEHDKITIIAAGRSSAEGELDELVVGTGRRARDAGGSFTSDNRYPGWQPNPGSAFTAEVADAWHKSVGERPTIAAIHAGLECGVIGERLGTDQIVSCGPTIHNAHSPDEQLHIGSSERILNFLHQLATRSDDV
jgi:dipeptidase D